MRAMLPVPLQFRRWLLPLLVIAGLAVMPLILVWGDKFPVGVSGVRESGQLRVLTIEGPTTYYHTADGPTGFEYDLLSAFADRLGARLKVVTAGSRASIIPRLSRGDAQLAAAALRPNGVREQTTRFSVPYQTIRTQVVYRRGDDRPSNFETLIGRKIVVPAGSPYAHLLRLKQAKYPKLTWTESSTRTIEDLLVDVWDGTIDITFAPSNLLAVVRQHHPDLKAAFGLDVTYQLAWAFPSDGNDTLRLAANKFLGHMRRSGELDRLIQRYYSAAAQANYVNVKTFRRRIKSVLPRYERLFKMAGARYGMDWRLLAAQSYQESYWRPGAVSPTGVKGLMQLTQATADYIDVEDRTDPRQSIMGGARYLRDLYERIDSSVAEPDRTWFALAAYNVGLGHLRDARVLAERQNKNPNLWKDVKSVFPLLAEPAWYPQTEYGRARGHEPVAYVTRIRSFYDILVEFKPAPVALDDLNIGILAL